MQTHQESAGTLRGLTVNVKPLPVLNGYIPVC